MCASLVRRYSGSVVNKLCLTFAWSCLPSHYLFAPTDETICRCRNTVCYRNNWPQLLWRLSHQVFGVDFGIQYITSQGVDLKASTEVRAELTSNPYWNAPCYCRYKVLKWWGVIDHVLFCSPLRLACYMIRIERSCGAMVSNRRQKIIKLPSAIILTSEVYCPVSWLTWHWHIASYSRGGSELEVRWEIPIPYSVSSLALYWT